jgi:hypothetical protein
MYNPQRGKFSVKAANQNIEYVTAVLEGRQLFNLLFHVLSIIKYNKLHPFI